MKKWLPLVLFLLFLSVFLISPAPVHATSEPPPPEPLADISPIITPAPRPVSLGQDISCFVGIANNGPTAAENVTLTMTLPAGTVFKSYAIETAGFSAMTPAVGATGTVQVSIPSMAAGIIMDSTLVVTPSGGPRTIAFTANVTSTTPDPNSGNNTLTETLQFLAPSADLALTMTDGETAGQIGRVSTYTLTLTNAGPDAASGVAATATLPSGTVMSAYSSSPGLTLVAPAIGSGGTVTMMTPSLAAGDNATATIGVVVLGTPRTLTFTAMATASTFDPTVANNSATDANNIFDTPPTVVSGHASCAGTATPAAANGNPVAVPFTVDMAGWFSDILSRPLTYRVASAQDNATEPNDVSAQTSITGSLLTYVPAAAQGGRTVTILIRSNNGVSDSGEAVTVTVTVLPQPQNRYLVEFDANGGVPTPESQTVAHGSKATEPGALTRIGYDFTDWHVADAPETPWDFATRTVNGALRLQAGWQKHQYPITYQFGSGTNAPSNPTYYQIGDEPIVLQAPIREGYRFDGWFDAATGGSQITTISPLSLMPITLYAHWTALQENVPATGESGPGAASLLGFMLLSAAAFLIVGRRIRYRSET